MLNLVDIYQTGVIFCFIANQSRLVSLHIYGNRDAIADLIPADGPYKFNFLLKPSHIRISDWWIAATYSNLAQLGTLAHQYAKGSWRHLGVEWAAVLLADSVEFRAIVDDEPSKYIEAAGR